MRTNIVIDDSLMQTALEVSGCKTKRKVIDEALKLLVQVRSQEAVRALKGRLKWEGNLEAVRRD